jgi:hypothetical protein
MRKLQAGGFSQRMPSKSLGIRLGARAMNGYARLMQHTPWPIAFSVIFCDRTVFDQINGFDPEIFIMEDYDFVYRSKKAGFKIGIITVPFYSSDRRFVGPDRPSCGAAYTLKRIAIRMVCGSQNRSSNTKWVASKPNLAKTLQATTNKSCDWLGHPIFC